MPACRRLLHFYERIGNQAGVDRWAGPLESSGAFEGRAYTAMSADLVECNLSPTTRPAPWVEVLWAALTADQAWRPHICWKAWPRSRVLSEHRLRSFG